MSKTLSCLAACVLVAWTAGTSDAQESREGVLLHLNPFRYFLRSEHPNRLPLDDLRDRLEQQGLAAEQIEARIQEIEAVRENGRPGTDGSRPGLGELRARLQERGVDPAMIEDRIARQAEHSTGGDPPGSRYRAAGMAPLAGEATLSSDELRRRMQERGLAEEQIAKRIEAVRENRLQSLSGDARDPDRIRAHLEQRGLGEAQIDARLERMSHRYGR